MGPARFHWATLLILIEYVILMYNVELGDDAIRLNKFVISGKTYLFYLRFWG